MFTGIVEEVGTVVSVNPADPQESLIIEARTVLTDAQPGDSIAVNGTCLTVTRLERDRFAVGVMPETVRRTNLGDLAPGDPLNLERALQPQSRLGGHFVQGHIDDVGTVSTVTPDGHGIAVRVTASPSILRYVVEKGYITIDGVSLTVTHVDDTTFGVALVAYTQDHVASTLHTVGARVNLEVDVLAKYLEKLVIH